MQIAQLHANAKQSLLTRLWIYQKERFPLAVHGPLIAVFTCCGVSLSAILRSQGSSPPFITYFVASITAILFFLQLRISDEFKDAKEDSLYRPYRPVPRGLVTLTNLAAVGMISAATQFMLILLYDKTLLPLLLLVWAYFLLMSKEFFISAWLRRHPALYLLSHMMVMPVIDIFVTACQWLPVGDGPPTGLWLFIVVSYCNGVIIEIGRKIRAPKDEESGVETYSAMWGVRGAANVWMLAVALTAITACAVSVLTHTATVTALILVALSLSCFYVMASFLQSPGTKSAARIEQMSIIWTAAMYLALGFLPHLLN